MNDSDKLRLRRERVCEIQLLVSVIFFGSSFIIQRYAMLPLKNFQTIGPVTYTACRYFISTVLTFLFKLLTYWYSIIWEEKDAGEIRVEHLSTFSTWKDLLFWAFLGSVCSVGGATLQQMGLVTLSAGKTAFITGMFVVFVPILEYITPGFGHQLTPSRWAMALVSMFGLFLLTGCAEAEVCFGGAIRWGEVMVFVSMLFWAASILATDTATKRVDAVMLTLFEFVFTTMMVAVIAVFVEPQFCSYPFQAIRRNGWNICILGFTEAMGFTFSSLGQRYTDSSRAALLYSLEGSFCSFLGYIFLHETLTYVELLGCALMFSSAVLSSSVFSTSTGATEIDANVEGISLLERANTVSYCEDNYQNNMSSSQHYVNKSSYNEEKGKESISNSPNERILIRVLDNVSGMHTLGSRDECSIPIITQSVQNFGSTSFK